MSAAGLIMERTRIGLSEAIVNILRSWPARHRQIFTQSHYCGETAESISNSVGLSVPEVHLILEQCNRMLRQSLKDFRRGTLISLRSPDSRAAEFSANNCFCRPAKTMA
jgi:hypothetical protein